MMDRRRFLRSSVLTAAGLYIAPEVMEPRRLIVPGWGPGVKEIAPGVYRLDVPTDVRSVAVVVRGGEATPIYSAFRRDPIGFASPPRVVEVRGVDIHGKPFTFVADDALDAPVRDFDTLLRDSAVATVRVPVPAGMTRLTALRPLAWRIRDGQVLSGLGVFPSQALAAKRHLADAREPRVFDPIEAMWALDRWYTPDAVSRLWVAECVHPGAAATARAGYFTKGQVAELRAALAKALGV